MTYEGFLRIGGVEVVNTERARGYSLTNGCPERWISSESECLTLGDALGDASYDFADIDGAPWYDISLPDLANRFYGVVGLDIAGTTDSTRQASRTEGVANGGVIGRTRKGMRGIRVTATLLARGRDALDYGSQWMSAVFDGGCSQHGDACSTTDAEFLAECPPPRGTVPDFSAWGTERTNLMVNPKPSAYPGSLWSQPSTGSVTADGVTSTLSSTTTPYMFTAPTAGGATAGHVYAFRAKIKGSVVAGSVASSYLIRPHKRTGNVYFPLTPAITVPADGAVHEVAFYWKATADVAAVGRFELSAGGKGTPLSGSTLSIDDVLIEDVGTSVPTSPPRPFFYGETPDGSDLLLQYVWAGAVNNSASLRQTRIIIDRDRTDVEYAAMVDPLRRFVHDIAVTSGPLDKEEFDFGQGFYGKTIEFTISSERAWIYSLTKQLALAPALPTVVQDTPYNLLPYPSAELADLIGKSANKCLAVNATGWSPLTIFAVSGSNPAPFWTTARSTLLSTGGCAASYRGLLQGVSTGSNVDGIARAGLQHEIDMASVATGEIVKLISSARFGPYTGEASDAHEMTGWAQWLTAGDAPVGAAIPMGSVSSEPALSTWQNFKATTVKPATATKIQIVTEYEFLWNSGPGNGVPSTIPVYMTAADAQVGYVEVGRNFSTNPSVEVNATGWAPYADGANIQSGMLTSGRVVGELAASGTSSYRVVFTATGAGANGAFGAEQEVNLSTRPVDSRVSFSYWAAEVLIAGAAPVRPPIDMIVYWRATAGGATLRTDVLGTVPVAGGALSVKSILPPVGANFALVRAQARVTSWPAGTIIRLYADALAVTVP